MSGIAELVELLHDLAASLTAPPATFEARSSNVDDTGHSCAHDARSAIRAHYRA